MIRQHVQNKWFSSADLVKVVTEMHRVAREEPTRWLKHGIDCKYVEVRVDMRTGDFCLKNAFGDLLSNDEIVGMYPGLAPIVPFE